MTSEPTTGAQVIANPGTAVEPAAGAARLAQRPIAVSPGHAAFRAQAVFGSLDGIRAISILAVIWHHARDLTADNSVFSRGFLGVDLFFVVSGFLIPTLLLRERERFGHVSLRGFYWRRFLRIFPPYYLALGLYAAASVSVGARSSVAAAFWQELPYYLTYTSNWIHAEVYGISWSLACEEQFYLVVPPLLLLLKTPTFLAAVVGFLVLNQACNFGVFDSWISAAHPGALSLEILQTTFTPIIMGVLLAFVMHSPQAFARVERVLVAGWFAPLTAALLGILVALPNSDISGTHRLAIHVVMTLVIAGCVASERNGLARVLRWAPLRRLGRLSYAIYLYHMIGLDLATRIVTALDVEATAVRVLATLVISWLMAEGSFALVERPLSKFRGCIGGR